MHTTLQLNPTTWDLMLDPSNNIALLSDSEAVAQDVACVLRTFQGECWFNTTQGVPYFQQVLGQPYNMTLMAALYRAAALTVPDVVQAQATFTAPSSSRILSGTVEVIDTAGQALNAHF
jgi:hypothetical protein